MALNPTGAPDQDQIDDGTQDPQLSRLYRPRPVPQGSSIPTADPAPQSGSSYGQGGTNQNQPGTPGTPSGMGPSPSTIYQPRFTTPPSGLWAGINEHSRPGSILGVISSFARAPYDQAMAANNMEMAKHAASLEDAKVQAESNRWNAIAAYDTKLAEQGGKMTREQSLANMLRTGQITQDEFNVLATHRQSAAPTEDPNAQDLATLPKGTSKEMYDAAVGNPRNDGESQNDWHHRIYGIVQQNHAMIEQGKTTRAGISANRPTRGAPTTVQVGGKTFVIDPNAAQAKPVAGLPDGAVTKPGVAPRAQKSPAEFKAGLVQQTLKGNGGQPITAQQMDGINQSTMAYMRGSGQAPEQRAAPGQPTDQSHVTQVNPPPPPGPEPMVQFSPSTGLVRVSHDGGKTFQLIQPQGQGPQQ